MLRGLGQDDFSFDDSSLNDMMDSASDFGFDTGGDDINFTSDDQSFNDIFTPDGQQKELNDLNAFGANAQKEVNAWMNTGQDRLNKAANTLVKNLTQVAGQAIKTLVPNLPAGASNNLQMFNHLKKQRDNVLNQQVKTMNRNVEEEVKKALAMQKKVNDAKFAADKKKWENMLKMQQRQLLAMRTARNVIQDRKTSTINANLVKKEKYKNLAIGAGVAILLFGGYYLYTKKGV
jgi:ElaB/YqjD/DUF883 family membrane-anchored ribosome-binding protein